MGVFQQVQALRAHPTPTIAQTAEPTWGRWKSHRVVISNVATAMSGGTSTGNEYPFQSSSIVRHHRYNLVCQGLGLISLGLESFSRISRELRSSYSDSCLDLSHHRCGRHSCHHVLAYQHITDGARELEAYLKTIVRSWPQDLRLFPVHFSNPIGLLIDPYCDRWKQSLAAQSLMRNRPRQRRSLSSVLQQQSRDAEQAALDRQLDER